MSKRGPKPTPGPTLKLRGSWRGKNRTQNLGEYNRPAMPQWLVGDARREWKRIIPILEKMGILAEVDRTMLALYCEAHADYKMYKDMIRKDKEQPILTSPKGYQYQNPIFTMRDKAWDRLKKACAEFGLSPSSRTGLAITPLSRDNEDKKRFFDPEYNKK